MNEKHSATMMNPHEVWVRDMTEEDSVAYIKEQCDLMRYDTEVVSKVEMENYRLFEKWSNLHIASYLFSDHYKFYPLVFCKSILTGKGILEVGGGEAGPFLVRQNTEYFEKPRVSVDPYVVSIPEDGSWSRLIIGGEKILETFGENSFDFVQAMECLEHVPQALSHEIAKQVMLCARRYALISCASLGVHCGPTTQGYIDRNKFMPYWGQPNIEYLMSLGYNIKLMTGYGIGMGCRIFATWDYLIDGPKKIGKTI